MSRLTVVLIPEVRTALHGWRQLHPDSAEAGGVLLGKYFSELAVVEVHAITSPQPADRRRRTFFGRESVIHHQTAVAVHRASEGIIGYLGGWHTHPEDSPTPSCIDTADWRRAVQRDRFSTPGLIFIIVGRRELRAWLVTSSRKPIIQVQFGD